MLDQAATVGMKRKAQWQQADAMQLPFQAGTFDAVVCQFGVMFFPDRPIEPVRAMTVTLLVPVFGVF